MKREREKERERERERKREREREKERGDMTEYWKSTQKNYWCELCKCWVRDSLQGRALHENGPKHKENVERKLKDAKINAERQERQEAHAKASLCKIESLARKQYEQDLKSGLGSSNQVVQQQQQLTLKQRETREELEKADVEIKRAAEQQYRISQSGSATASEAANVSSSSSSSQIRDWAYDPHSGYYFSKQYSCYYDGHSKMYYYDNQWRKTAPVENKVMAETAKLAKYYSDAPENALEKGHVGPIAPGTVKQDTTLGPGVSRKQAQPVLSSSSSQQQQQQQQHARIVMPVRKVAERTNQSIGGYQMPLYGGKVGGAKQIGIIAKKVQSIGTPMNAGVRKKKTKKAAIAGKKVKSAKDMEEERAVKAREAAKKRVEQRTMTNFGFS